MRIAMMQFDPKVGDVDGNLGKALAALEKVHADCDLAVFPELYITGYPPKDLLERPAFIERTQRALNALRESSARFECGIIMGMPRPIKDHPAGLYNAAALIYKGDLLDEVHKSLLPFYDVFDETRYFTPASERRPVKFKGTKIALTICEDMWTDRRLWPEHPYKLDPLSELNGSGVDLMINIAASPFHAGKDAFRYDLVRRYAQRYGCPFIFLNQVGGNDELIFDGNSMAVDKEGGLIARADPFRESVLLVDTESPGTESFIPQERISAIHEALVTGLRDYVRKCRFSEVVLGHSGGIDSAVCCAIAVEAVGPENVTACSLPSEYSSPESAALAREMAELTGVEYLELEIDPIYQSYKDALRDVMDIEATGEVAVYLQNIQARIRGNILMAFSNRYGKLLISTGNKSELAVGYCTLYGDMAGGLALISDVPKSDVYELAGHINKIKRIIPEKIIRRTPSAELAPGQKDQDTLPEYHLLDNVLYQYLHEHRSLESIVASGLDEGAVRWVIDAVNRNEYKRRQMPPGLRVTSKAFGSGRRMPIAAEFEQEGG